MINWKPQTKQEIFLANPAYEVLFGGTKGPGKTDCLLADSMRQGDQPDYRALILRRTTPRLVEIVDRSKRWFANWGKFNNQSLTWTFPHPTIPNREGWKLRFGHCEHEDDKWNYQGHEYHYIGFDQLEEFTLSQYLFLMAQNRTANPNIKCYIRATANPGNIGHAWVKRRFIGPKDHPKCPGDGTIKYFLNVDGVEKEVGPQNKEALSRSFVFSTVYDNEILLASNPQYIQVLENLPEKERRMMLLGDWEIFAGMFFSEWDEHHIVRDLTMSPELSYFMSMDYGYSAPSSVGFWCVFPDGRLHRFQEIYVEKHNYDELAHEIKRFMGRFRYDYLVCDPAVFGDRSHHRKGVAGETGADIMQEILGDVPVMRGDNRRVSGWARMRVYLQHKLVTCSPKCTNSIRTIPDMIHDDTRQDDLNSKAEDHAADDWRYALMSRPIPAAAQVETLPAFKTGQNVTFKFETREERVSNAIQAMISKEMNNRKNPNSNNYYMGDQW